MQDIRKVEDEIEILKIKVEKLELEKIRIVNLLITTMSKAVTDDELKEKIKDILDNLLTNI
jgi:hypothetical protein